MRIAPPRFGLAAFAALLIACGCAAPRTKSPAANTKGKVASQTGGSKPILEEIPIAARADAAPGGAGVTPVVLGKNDRAWEKARAQGDRRSPLVEVTRPETPSDDDEAAASNVTRSGTAVERSALHAMLERLLAELRPFEGKPESELDDGQRLTKHRLQEQLIALHFLLPPGELDHLDPLLKSLEGCERAGVVRRLLAAAFYHSVDCPELRDRELAELKTAGVHPEPFRLENVQLCSDIFGYRKNVPIADRVFHAGDSFWIYGELTHLQYRRAGEKWRRGVKVDVYLEKEGGEVVDRRAFTGPDGDWSEFERAKRLDYLSASYTLPLRVKPGDYRLAVEVTDLNAHTTAREEVGVRIRR